MASTVNAPSSGQTLSQLYQQTMETYESRCQTYQSLNISLESFHTLLDSRNQKLNKFAKSSLDLASLTVERDRYIVIFRMFCRAQEMIKKFQETLEAASQKMQRQNLCSYDRKTLQLLDPNLLKRADQLYKDSQKHLVEIEGLRKFFASMPGNMQTTLYTIQYHSLRAFCQLIDNKGQTLGVAHRLYRYNPIDTFALPEPDEALQKKMHAEVDQSDPEKMLQYLSTQLQGSVEKTPRINTKQNHRSA